MDARIDCFNPGVVVSAGWVNVGMKEMTWRQVG